MRQDEFWQGFRQDARIRQAHIYHALHFGPDPTVWGKNANVPTFYNELAFLATLEVFDQHPTRKSAMQMGPFIFKRGAGAGEMWLIDPANAKSQARVMLGNVIGRAKDDYRLKNPVAGYEQTGGFKIPSAAKKSFLAGMFGRVRDELCAYGGVLNQYLDNIGALMGAPGGEVTHDLLVGARYKRLDGINRVPGKGKWLKDLNSKFSGTGFASKKIGKTFDTAEIGLVGGWLKPLPPVRRR